MFSPAPWEPRRRSCTDTQASGPSGGVYTTPGHDSGTAIPVAHSWLPVQPDSALAVELKPEQLRSVQGWITPAIRRALAWLGAAGRSQRPWGGDGEDRGRRWIFYLPCLERKKQPAYSWRRRMGRRVGIDLFGEANNLLADVAGIPPLPARVHKARPVKKRQARPVRRKKAAKK